MFFQRENFFVVIWMIEILSESLLRLQSNERYLKSDLISHFYYKIYIITDDDVGRMLWS